MRRDEAEQRAKAKPLGGASRTSVALATARNHLTRVQAVIDFIEDHLREPLCVEQLARVCGLSVWYFQRVFRGVAGETVADYVRLRRLSSALAELRSGRRRVLDIALDYQFEEAASFTRAVRGFFGVPPSALRQRGQTMAIPPGKRRITPDYLDHLYSGISIEPRFVTLPQMRVVGISAPCIIILSQESNSLAVVPALRQAFHARMHELSGRVNSQVFFGIFMPLPEAQRGHPDEWCYMACAQVHETAAVPAGMRSEMVSGGRYAMFTHRGLPQRIEHTYNYIYGSWLPRSGEVLRDAPEVEIYSGDLPREQAKAGLAGDLGGAKADFKVDLYIPVQ